MVEKHKRGNWMTPFPNKKYKVIYPDPPWDYRDKRKGRGGAGNHYQTMSIKEIQALPVADLAADDCLLFIWCTFPLLPEGIDTIRAWGFKYKTLGFVWAKANKRLYSILDLLGIASIVKGIASIFDPYMGGGSYTRANAEVCLIGVKGRACRLIKDKSIINVVYAPRGRHSEKPAEVREKIERLVGPGLPMIELFARKRAPGWDAWGNEV